MKIEAKSKHRDALEYLGSLEVIDNHAVLPFVKHKRLYISFVENMCLPCRYILFSRCGKSFVESRKFFSTPRAFGVPVEGDPIGI